MREAKKINPRLISEVEDKSVKFQRKSIWIWIQMKHSLIVYSLPGIIYAFDHFDTLVFLLIAFVLFFGCYSLLLEMENFLNWNFWFLLCFIVLFDHNIRNYFLLRCTTKVAAVDGFGIHVNLKIDILTSKLKTMTNLGVESPFLFHNHPMTRHR